jgi:multidrug efflux system membrane fusion protein
MNLPRKINHKENAPYRVPPQKRPLNHRFGFWVSIFFIVIVLIFVRKYFVGSSSDKQHKQTQEVVLAVASTKDVPVYLQGLGSVLPVYTITVQTQINGILLNVYYTEGQFVKAGQIIAQIDPRPYQAQLAQNEAQLSHDQATLTNDQLNLSRYQVLWKQNSVSKQILDTQAATVKQDLGTLEVDKAQIAATQLNLYYCQIKSPVDGRIGLRLVDPGNYVQTSSTTGIAVITTINPITVEFTLPEDNIPQVMKKFYEGKPLEVQALDRAQVQLLATGNLLAIDNQVDVTTGTFKLRAQFDNKGYQLFANQFVNVKLLIDTLKNAVIVPTAAVQQGTQGTYSYVLNDDKKTVHMQPVVTGVTQGDFTTISSGISAGQSVVTEGADNLKDGAKVTIAGEKPPAKSVTETLAAIFNFHAWKLA